MKEGTRNLNGSRRARSSDRPRLSPFTAKGKQTAGGESLLSVAADNLILTAMRARIASAKYFSRRFHSAHLIGGPNRVGAHSGKPTSMALEDNQVLTRN
jgi:hypothetical protein